MTATPSKSLIESKTFWYNTGLFVCYLANRQAQVIDPGIAEPFAVIMATGGNHVLRLVTKSKIDRVI